MQQRDPQLAGAMILHAERIGHAALPLHAILERHSGQVALPVIGPGVIDAAEILFAFALRIQTDQRAAMRAAVLKGIDLAIRVARDDHRRIADFRGAKITGLRQFHLERQIVPARTMEDALLLRPIGLLGLEHPIRHPRQPLGGPRLLMTLLRDRLLFGHD